MFLEPLLDTQVSDLVKTGWIIVQTEYNQACLNCWGAADNARAESPKAHSTKFADESGEAKLSR